MSIGADDYLTKPFTAGELLTAVMARLRKRETLDLHYISEAEKVTRKRIDHLLSISPAVIYSYNYSDFKRLTYISDNIYSIFGYRPEEFTDRNAFWPEHVHPEDRPIFFKKLSSLNNQDYCRIEYRFLHRDGTYRWIYDEQKVVRDSDGSPGEIVGSWLDITEKKKSETDQMRLATAVEQAAESIAITDINEDIQYVNPAFTLMTGYDRKEALGKNIRILNNEKYDKEFYDTIRERLASGKVWKGQTCNKKKDGSLCHIKTTISPTKDETGKIINYVYLMSDITKELGLERQLRQSEKLKAMGTLAGGIAHDFNNILLIINGYAEMALYRNRKTDTSYYFEQILKAGNQAKEMVKQILLFSRPVKDNLKPLKIIPFIKETIKLLKPTLKKNIHIVTEIKAECDIIMAETSQMNQMLMNLYKNAVDSMAEKGGALKISLLNIELDEYSVTAYPGLVPGSYIRLTVSDSGCGIPAEVLDRIFDPFFTTKEKIEGTGLGLSIVHGIVKKFGGFISVCSEAHIGTTFQILLPIAESNIIEKSEYTEILSEGDSSILFVDDEKEVGIMVKEMLESIGHKVTLALSGREGLEIFSADPSKFDFVITDQLMPGMKGTEFASQLIKIDPALPVLLCTGFSDVPLSHDELKGIKEVICKPFNFYEISRMIEKFANKIRVV